MTRRRASPRGRTARSRPPASSAARPAVASAISFRDGIGRGGDRASRHRSDGGLQRGHRARSRRTSVAHARRRAWHLRDPSAYGCRCDQRRRSRRHAYRGSDRGVGGARRVTRGAAQQLGGADSARGGADRHLTRDDSWMFHEPTTPRGKLMLGLAHVAAGLLAIGVTAWVLGGWWVIAGAFLLWMSLRRGLRYLRAGRAGLPTHRL